MRLFFRDRISSYIEAVEKERPLLAKIVNKYGDMNMLDFSTMIFQKGMLQRDIYRQEFIELLHLSFPQTPSDIIRQYDVSLRQNPIVSTADHHSIINCPLYLNSNILLSLFAKKFSQNKNPIVTPPILSFSSLPLNNAAYLRGILLTGSNGEKRFSFFGAKQRHEIMLLVNPLSFSERQINKWIKNNKERFTKEELKFIKEMFLDLIANSDINNGKNFLEQTQIFNSWLWGKIVPGVKLPFLPIEKIATTFISKIIVKHKSWPLYNFLFNYPLEKQDKLFNGIYGAWNLAKLNNYSPGGGTFFFWGVTKEKRIIPLKRVRGFLISQNEDFKSIKWHIDDLIQALENKKIIPSILLIYLIMAHYGLYCSGAFNQIAYLTPMIKQYKNALLEMSETKEAYRIEKILTDGAHAFLYFLFGESKDKVIPLCSFNILQQKIKLNSIIEILSKISLKEVFAITAPLIFPFIVDPVKRDKMNFSFPAVYNQLKTKVPKKLVVQKW